MNRRSERARPVTTALGHVLALSLAAGLVACATPSRPPAVGVVAPAAALSAASVLAGDDGQGYVGLALADDDHGLRITYLLAGPAAEAGFAAGDYLFDVEGGRFAAADFRARVAAASPGDRLAVLRERGGERVAVELVVGDHGAWSGPARRPRARAPVPGLPPPDWYATRATRPTAVPAVATVAAALAAMLDATAREGPGYNRSPWADRALADGATLAAWPGAVRDTFAATARSRSPWHDRFCRWRDAACRLPPGPAVTDLNALAQALADLAGAVDSVFAALPGGRSALLGDGRAWLARFVAVPPASIERDDLRVMRASQLVDGARLLALFGALEQLAGDAARLGTPRAPVAAARPAGIEGELLAVLPTARGAVVMGGAGANRYTMDGLLAVIDLGGDDTYEWAGGPPPVQLLVDHGGNDRYRASFGGAAAGILGIAVLRDLEGDDDYHAGLAGCASALFGFGLLDDRGGRDHYDCGGWSEGAALYGGAALVDRGGKPDRYTAPAFAQGVGGPGGVGVLHDDGGDDVYHADGVLPSVYGTPGVYFAMSQGVGYGPRPYDHGGLGLLLDDGGDDRYFAGEFGQGGGYFGGLGLLDDAAGDDRYAGQRYAQGFAVHQAAGVLRDSAGRDLYWSTTAAGQGAAWDQARAMLIEVGGDDQYRAATLSQGAAAQQAEALLFDGGGADVYTAQAPAQGAAGPNEYNYAAAAPVCSLGVLEDRAGADRYSSNLANDGARLVDGAGDGFAAGHVGLAVDGMPPPEALAGLPAASCGEAP
ncbi:MAG: hypothetical protein AB7Q81_11945 [Gammaproteobacteria bacterium]